MKREKVIQLAAGCILVLSVISASNTILTFPDIWSRYVSLFGISSSYQNYQALIFSQLVNLIKMFAMPVIGFLAVRHVYKYKKPNQLFYVFLTIKLYAFPMLLYYFLRNLIGENFWKLEIAILTYIFTTICTVFLLVLVVSYNHYFVDRETPAIQYDKSIYKLYQGKRFKGFLIDGILILGYAFPFQRILEDSPFPTTGFGFFSGYIAMFVFYFFCELLLRQTPGKAIMGIEVIPLRPEGSFGLKIFLRTLCRFIPFEVFSFLFSPFHGWHDRLSKTNVRLKEFDTQEKESEYADDILDFEWTKTDG